MRDGILKLLNDMDKVVLEGVKYGTISEFTSKKIQDIICKIQNNLSDNHCDNADNFKATIKEAFMSKGFVFEKGKKYFAGQDSHYIYLLDDNGNTHTLSYEDTERCLECV